MKLLFKTPTTDLHSTGWVNLVKVKHWICGQIFDHRRRKLNMSVWTEYGPQRWVRESSRGRPKQRSKSDLSLFVRHLPSSFSPYLKCSRPCTEVCKLFAIASFFSHFASSVIFTIHFPWCFSLCTVQLMIFLPLEYLTFTLTLQSWKVLIFEAEYFYQFL